VLTNFATVVTAMLMCGADDQVYMPKERLLDEYVLNDIGKIWVGPYGSSKGREWIFGQFDAVVLPAVDLMMSRSSVAPVNRGNPIYVTRAISKMVSKLGKNTDLVHGQQQNKSVPLLMPNFALMAKEVS
jgi:transglutaminase 1